MNPLPLILGIGALGLARAASSSSSSTPQADEPLPVGDGEGEGEGNYTSGRPVMGDEDADAEFEDEFEGDPVPTDTTTPPGRVVISMMALGTLPPGWSGWKLIEWPGAPPASGSGHQSWVPVAAGLRVNGRLLPALLKRYGFDPGSAVVGVGFSAGSNNGLRELLRHPDDRKQIVGVVAIDGAHWNVKKTSDAPPPEAYWDWKGEVDPFAQAALEASRGGTPMVATASQVGRPGAQLTMTREGIKTLGAWLDSQGASRSSAPAPFDTASSLTANVSGKDITKSSVEAWAQGNFTASLWPGNQPADHTWQARALAREALGLLQGKGVA